MRPHTYTLPVLALVGSSLAHPDGIGGHHDNVEHGASAPGPSAPQSGYVEPQASYGVPDYGYGAGYESPNSVYGSSPNYGVYGALTDRYTEVFGGESTMSMMVIPILIAATLFLLIFLPTTNEVPVMTAPGRKRKRDVSSDKNLAENMFVHVQDMYMAILKSEECFERIACEIENLDAGCSKQMTKSMELFAPKKYTKRVKSFNPSKDCKKDNKCRYF